MNLRHVEAFRLVSVSASMTEAARMLHTSQPQISRLIQQLEEIVGFLLFHRNGSRLSLTSEGALFAQDVDRAFAGLAGLEVTASRIRSFTASKLSLAAMPRLAGGVLAKSVARFKQQFPDVLVSIHSGDASSVNSWIGTGMCDLGLAMLYTETSGLRCTSIAQLKCVAVLPVNHPLAELPELSPAVLDGVRMIFPPTNSPLREKLDVIFQAAGARPVITAEASLGASICSLVAAGLGVSILNELAAVEDLVEGQVLVKPFRPEILSDIMLLYPEHRESSRLVDAFSACLIEMLEEELRLRLGR